MYAAKDGLGVPLMGLCPSRAETSEDGRDTRGTHRRDVDATI